MEFPNAEYVRVALDLPIEAAYQYLLPEPMRAKAKLGSIVRVPVQSREAYGCVIGFELKPAAKVVKPVHALISDPFHLTPELIDLGRWMSEYYLAPLGEALRTISFIGFSEVTERTETQLCLTRMDYWLRNPESAGPDGKSITVQQRRVIESLIARANEPTPPAILRIDANVSDAVVTGLLKRDILERIESAVVVEDGYAYVPQVDTPPEHLSESQARALETILEAVRDKRFLSCLLHGATGSGKTEVYLRAIEEVLRQGRQAIVLEPEIALTPQAVDRFRARFGDIVGVYHSRQTLRQKYELGKRIESGEIQIVIGARSAVFSPFPSLGIIIVDEEHTNSYKQDSSPRYNARDVAIMRAKSLDAVVVLGSATPSLESYFNAKNDKHVLLEMPERVANIPMPAVELVDMGQELRKTHGNPGVLSDRLREAIQARLDRREQALLLLNRRGYASVSICLECDATEQCKECSVPMTYHRSHGFLVCHLCGLRRKKSEVCPACNSKEMELIGVGTQKVEETIEALFPKARLIRLDSDSARGRTAWTDAWAQIRDHQFDLILGTQMIAKGLHLEKVTLVGVISADSGILQPDFRAAERTFSLLAQAAGRSGRGETAGEVIIQTYQPGHYAIQFATQHDFCGFYEREMRLRRALRFPPVQRLISLLVSSDSQEAARAMSGRLGGLLRNLSRTERFESVAVLGPAPCAIERIRGRWRWRIVLRCPNSSSMRELVRAGLNEFGRVPGNTRVAVQLDVDPQDLL